MVSLSSVGERFATVFTVIENGSGIVRGEITETEQNAQPNYVFAAPRRVLRTSYPTLVKPGMVLRTPASEVHIVGDNGPSEQAVGTIWQSFRLFEANGRYRWHRRGKRIDPITKMERDTNGDTELGLIYAAIESMDRVQFDRELHRQFSQSRVITYAPLQVGDFVDNRQVSKVDKDLGLYIGVLI